MAETKRGRVKIRRRINYNEGGESRPDEISIEIDGVKIEAPISKYSIRETATRIPILTVDIECLDLEIEVDADAVVEVKEGAR